MLYKTRAISLNYIRYRDRSVIARFFTEEFGLQSFVVNGVRSSKSRISPALFQALNLVDLVQYHDGRKELNRLSEIRPAKILSTIPMHPAKSAMAIFVAEYIGKVLRENQENKPLFSSAYDWILGLDSMPSGFESSHIGFVWNSFSSLGISPESWTDVLQTSLRLDPDFQIISEAYFESGADFRLLKVPAMIRQQILDALVRYAASQLEGMGEIRSLAVLRQVFS